MSTPTSVQQQPPITANGDVAAAAAAAGSLGNNSNISNYPLRDVPNPHPHDVLCGRGGATNSHIGNSHWRTLVTANKELYVTLPKREKQLLSKSIVHAVRSQNPPGRFLQKDFGTGLWFDVGDVRALEKTSQALREGAPQLRDKLKVTDPTNNSSNISSSTEAQEATRTTSTVVLQAAAPLPLLPSLPPPVPAQGPVADQRKNSNPCAAMKDPHNHASSAAAPSSSLLENGQQKKDTGDNNNDDVVPPPPSMLDPTGEFSFGTITIPDPSEVGGLENGFSFGSVMSGVVEPSSSSRYYYATACSNDTIQIIGGPPQQHHQQQQQQQNSQHHQHSSRRPILRDSLADAAGRLIPPTGLQANELSFGSIIMTDAEQSRLETNIQQQQQQQQYNNSYNAQPLYASTTQRDNNQARFGRPTPAEAAAGDDVMGVQPVDGGLEPAGLSAGSMMSIGTINTTNLENAGMSLGSMYSAVDGGFEAIGTSFGSMSIGGPNNNNNNNNALPAVVAKGPPLPPPPMEAVPTFLRQKRSKGNLLECSDTESEDEEHSAHASAQKSAEWEKLKATFEAQMAGGAYNSATVPPSFNMPPSKQQQQQPLVLDIPETGFGRDLSQMSAFSVGDGYYQNDHLPPQGGLTTRTESDELRALELTLLNRGSSLASEHFEVPHQPDDE